MKKIEHLGIAVKNLENSIALFEKLLNTNCYKTETVESEKVATAFFKTGESKIELVAGIDEGNAIDKFISNRGEGLHHIAFEVDDIFAEVERLKNEGFSFVQDQPKDGADNKIVCFLHPKTTNGVLIELVMEKK